MAPVAAHRICRRSATKAAHLPSLSGSDKRRHMNRSEIPSFVCVSRRVSLPFNLGALNQSKDRLDRWGERCDAKSVSIARRIIDRNPALSRDSVGGICDHHGRTQRNEYSAPQLQFWGCRVPGIGKLGQWLPNAWARLGKVAECQCLGRGFPKTECFCVRLRGGHQCHRRNPTITRDCDL